MGYFRDQFHLWIRLEVFWVNFRWFLGSFIDTTTGKASWSLYIKRWQIWKMRFIWFRTYTWFSCNQVFAFQWEDIIYDFAFCFEVFKNTSSSKSRRFIQILWGQASDVHFWKQAFIILSNNTDSNRLFWYFSKCWRSF